MPWHISKSSMMFKTKILICNVFALCNEDLNIKVLGYYVPVCIIPFFFSIVCFLISLCLLWFPHLLALSRNHSSPTLNDQS